AHTGEAGAGLRWVACDLLDGGRDHAGLGSRSGRRLDGRPSDPVSRSLGTSAGTHPDSPSGNASRYQTWYASALVSTVAASPASISDTRSRSPARRVSSPTRSPSPLGSDRAVTDRPSAPLGTRASASDPSASPRAMTCEGLRQPISLGCRGSSIGQ